MKKVFIFVALFLAIPISVMAEIQKTNAEKNISDAIFQVRSVALSARTGFMAAKGRLVDMATVYADKIDASDAATLNGYQTKIQQAIDGMNAIINKIDGDFPSA